MHFIQRLIFCLVLYFTGLELLAKTPSCHPLTEPNDWILQKDSSSLCGGHYQPYSPIDLSYFQDESELPIQIEFDSSLSTLEGTSTFYQATAIQGRRILTANQIDIARQNNEWQTLNALGQVEFHQPNISVFAKSAFYAHATRHFQLECANLRWYPRHARATSTQAELFSDRRVVLHDTHFTTCPPGNNSWALHAKEITLYPNTGRAKAKHIVLHAHDVPVFYWPYLDYPITNQRQSGFLFPSLGSASQSGMILTIPYYFNLAPNYDLTLSVSGYSKRGLGILSKFRYINPNTSLSFDVQFLPNDSSYQTFKKNILQQIPSGYSTVDPRIQGLGNHNYRLGLSYDQQVYWKNWLLNINYHYVSDDNYFVDLGHDILAVSTIHLPQSASLQYFGDHWFHTLNVEEYQVLQAYKGDILEEIYRRQPQWVFEADYPNILGPLRFNLNGEMVHFTHPGDPILLRSQIQGQRIHLQPAVSLPIRRSYWEWIPTFYADWLGYHLDLSNTGATIDSHPNRFTPIYTMDGKLIFERDLDLFGHPWTQTFTPRLFYTYIPYRDQSQYPNFDSGIINYSYAQLYRYNRFSGGDFLNEANQVSLSMNTNFLDAQYFEWLRMGIGQIFYFTPQKVMLCNQGSSPFTCDPLDDTRRSSKHSNLLSEFVLTTPSQFQTGAFIEWGTHDALIQQASVYLHLPLHEQLLLNLNYYFTRQDLKDLDNSLRKLGRLHQGDASLLMPVTPKINFLTRVHYDFEYDQFIEMLGGVEYNSCCFAWQIVFSRYRQLGNALIGRDFANQIMLQFVFKGLSSIALNKVDDKLDKKIPGYRPLAERVALPAVH